MSTNFDWQHCNKGEWQAASRLARQLNLTKEQAILQVMQAVAEQQHISVEVLLQQRALEHQRLEHLKASKRAASLARYQAQRAHREVQPQEWSVWFDGSAKPNPGHCRCGIVLKAPDGRTWNHSANLGHGSSSDAEYQALLAALQLALQQGAHRLMVFGDSRVVIDDVQADAEAGSPLLAAWRAEAQAISSQFETLRWCWIPRALNSAADQLAGAA
ncbi:ribonuclease HI family protein [Undibacterium cyanobacteriorum]|uniref:Ribonuclease HI family protein n=1 Tax=Undibacterium cyanobacteriorum TaxID=3073561 RepID=A0ABY9RP39_9BURK|nr:ribonuclease HI family protein [Undibacterium sp. 20NA77.5]WMW81761.1 ribonuclease HI family protein [Undibacterium sp. 20NA77.5]